MLAPRCLPGPLLAAQSSALCVCACVCVCVSVYGIVQCSAASAFGLMSWFLCVFVSLCMYLFCLLHGDTCHWQPGLHCGGPWLAQALSSWHCCCLPAPLAGTCFLFLPACLLEEDVGASCGFPIVVASSLPGLGSADPWWWGEVPAALDRPAVRPSVRPTFLRCPWCFAS